MRCLDCLQVRGLDIPLGRLSVDLKKRSVPRGPSRCQRGSYRHVVAHEGGGSVEADQVYRDKLWGAAEEHALTVIDKVVRNVESPQLRM